MKTVYILIVVFLATGAALAQRGDIVVPLGAQLTVPAGAQICADRIFANNPGYGTLTLADASGLCRGMSVVPVELLSFSASAIDGVVQLRWTTVTEVNCHGFEVQRSIPGSDAEWRPLGFVAGAGTTTEQRHYSFGDPRVDVPSNVPTLAYRLRIVDLDGTFEYSPVVEVRIDADALAYTFHPVYPNPASDRVNITFTLPEPSSVTLTLYAMTGEEVLRLMDERAVDRGFHVATIPTAGLGPGTYMIELRTRSGRRTQVLVLLD